MATIFESAKAYEPSQTLNIADLESVDVNLQLEERTGKKRDESGKETGETFTYKVIVVDGQDYRVPNTVLEKLQEALKIKSDIKKFKVNKTGSGLATRYSVEVLE